MPCCAASPVARRESAGRSDRSPRSGTPPPLDKAAADAHRLKVLTAIAIAESTQKVLQGSVPADTSPRNSSDGGSDDGGSAGDPATEATDLRVKVWESERHGARKSAFDGDGATEDPPTAKAGVSDAPDGPLAQPTNTAPTAARTAPAPAGAPAAAVAAAPVPAPIAVPGVGLAPAAALAPPVTTASPAVATPDPAPAPAPSPLPTPSVPAPVSAAVSLAPSPESEWAAGLAPVQKDQAEAAGVTGPARGSTASGGSSTLVCQRRKELQQLQMGGFKGLRQGLPTCFSCRCQPCYHRSKLMLSYVCLPACLPGRPSLECKRQGVWAWASGVRAQLIDALIAIEFPPSSTDSSSGVDSPHRDEARAVAGKKGVEQRAAAQRAAAERAAKARVRTARAGLARAGAAQEQAGRNAQQPKQATAAPTSLSNQSESPMACYRAIAIARCCHLVAAAALCATPQCSGRRCILCSALSCVTRAGKRSEQRGRSRRQRLHGG
jgi:hypothetical protein